MHHKLTQERFTLFHHRRRQARKPARLLRAAMRPIVAEEQLSRSPANSGKPAISLSQRPLAFFLALIVFAAWLPTVLADDLAVWPDRGPYRMVGSLDADVIKMPTQVVEAVRHTVLDDPSTWHIYQSRDFSKCRDRVLAVEGNEATVHLLVERKLWINLCAVKGVPFINDLKPSLRVVDLQNEKKLEKYLDEVGYFHTGNAVAALTKDFQRAQLTEDRVHLWLAGDRKPKMLITLCRDPVVTTDRDRVAIRYNVMRGNGAVEQWTLRLRADEIMRLETIEKVPLYKEGTFYYPLIH